MKHRNGTPRRGRGPVLAVRTPLPGMLGDRAGDDGSCQVGDGIQQRLEAGGVAVGDPLAGCRPRGRPRRNRARGQREHGNQSVPYGAWASRIGHLGGNDLGMPAVPRNVTGAVSKIMEFSTP